MMRPMKLAGNQLLFGEGTLKHLETLHYHKVVIVLADDIMYQNGVMDIVEKHLNKAKIAYSVFKGVEPDPGLKTVLKGARFMLEERPDLILAIGGGSTMDAAKAMWIYYEHPYLKTLEPLKDKATFPTLRHKAHFACVPTTAGTASEVSRSIVITDDETGVKHGIGNMEMMPDIAILDPITTVSMPKHITAETGMDALTHALEAIVSNRANIVSDVLARQAIIDILTTLPLAIEHPKDMAYREKMLNASMLAGLAFTNVSLGIVHSIAHSLGSIFKLPHGLSNAIVLPYIIDYNSQDEKAKAIYDDLASAIGKDDLKCVIVDLNRTVGIPLSLKERIPDQKAFYDKLEDVALLSINDGCTKTNPIIPSYETFKALITKVYEGDL
jgi:alcohol dehydrogenase class IV